MYKHRATSSTTLPPIPEDAAQSPPPPLPPRASHRPLQTHFGFGNPPTLRHNGPPPAYSVRARNTNLPYLGGENEGPFDEKLEALRNNRQVAKRGGWKRLCVFAFIVLGVAVGLGVGLGVGLTRKKNSNNNGSGSNGGDSNNQNQPETSGITPIFPAGSYSIPTYLSTVTTNCTSNPSTWLCYPYTTYAQSPSSSSEAIFTWIITPNSTTTTTNTPINYTISSTPNLFSIHFSNTSLVLEDAGLDTERYSFEISIKKPVIPNVALTQSNQAATCWFNQTVFTGSLYTRMAKTYDGVGGGNGSGSGDGYVFGAWPYAVRIEEYSTSGSGTPTCVDSEGNVLGDFSVSVSVSGSGSGSGGDGEVCDCLYLNSGT